MMTKTLALMPQQQAKMKILKRFIDDEAWNETTQDECIEHTEGDGYWKPGSVVAMLAEGHIVRTPFALYKAVEIK